MEVKVQNYQIPSADIEQVSKGSQANITNRMIDASAERLLDNVTREIQLVKPVSESEFMDLTKKKAVLEQANLVLPKAVFTLFKLDDGKIYTRIRDLDSGEVTYYPAIDADHVDEGLFKEPGIIYDLQG